MLEHFSKNLAMPLKNCTLILLSGHAVSRELKNEVYDKVAKLSIPRFIIATQKSNTKIAKEILFIVDTNIFSFVTDEFTV